MKTFYYTREVQFADTDMAGVVHFSTILRYVEEAEHAAMTEAGVFPITPEGGFPKVRVECDYRRPLRFQNEISIEMKLEKVGGKSLTWSFSITANDFLAASGGLVTALVDKNGVAQEISQKIRNKLK